MLTSLRDLRIVFVDVKVLLCGVDLDPLIFSLFVSLLLLSLSHCVVDFPGFKSFSSFERTENVSLIEELELATSVLKSSSDDCFILGWIE